MPKTLVNLDIDLLRTFVVIAMERNFTRAAERLMRQQSTVSLQRDAISNQQWRDQ